MKESCTFSFVSSLLTGSWAFSSQLQAHYPPPHQNQSAQTLTASSLFPSILWWSLGFLQVLAHLALIMQAFTEVGKFDSKVAPLFSNFLATLVQL